MLRIDLARATRPAVLVLTALLAAPHARAHDPDDEVGAHLVRPASAPDPDARGHLELSSEGRRQEFELEVDRVDAGLPHEVWLETAPGSGQLSFIAPLTGHGHDDELELELETQRGDMLPFGVTDVGQLLGRAVEVRVGGVVVLTATIPASFDDRGKRSANGRLQPDAAAPDAHTRGSLAVSVQPHKGKHTIEVVAERVDGRVLHELYMDDGTGTLALVGPLRLDDDDDDDDRELKLELKTKKGQTLPEGLASVADLLGRRIEVRADGAAVLFAHVPTWFEEKRSGERELDVDLQRTAPGRLRGELELEIDDRGHEELQLELEHVDGLRHHELFVESAPGSQSFVELADLLPEGGAWPLRRLELELDSKRGDPLPFGARSLDELLGRRVEVRADGRPVLSGELPATLVESR